MRLSLTGTAQRANRPRFCRCQCYQKAGRGLCGWRCFGELALVRGSKPELRRLLKIRAKMHATAFRLFQALHPVQGLPLNWFLKLWRLFQSPCFSAPSDASIVQRSVRATGWAGRIVQLLQRCVGNSARRIEPSRTNGYSKALCLPTR